MVECDDQTAELHMAMAEMMAEDEEDRNVEQWQGDQLNIMQFTMAQEKEHLWKTGSDVELFNNWFFILFHEFL